MKRILFLLITSLILLSGCSEGPQLDSYGDGVSVEEQTSIAAILDAPESFLGKTVRVEGKVEDVCMMKGCWIEIAGENPGQKIKVKVEDDVIVFPAEAKGKQAIAQGEVYRIELNEQQAMSYAAHFAEEQGVPFDSSTVTGPMVIYQLKGEGALIAE